MRRVLILDNQLLVGAGIQLLLSGEADLEIIGLPSLNCEDLAQLINKLEPDVIVLDEINHLTHLAGLLALLNNFSRLRIVVVRVQDDLIQIYDKQEVLVTRSGQLSNIIRAG